MKRLIFMLMCLLILTISAGCAYLQGAPTYGDTTTFATSQLVYLSCGNSCQAQAQCGNDQLDGKTYVFLNKNTPATQNHNTAVSQNTPARVVSVRPESLVGLTNRNTAQTVNFYEVALTNEDGSTTNVWAAGWCVGDQKR